MLLRSILAIAGSLSHEHHHIATANLNIGAGPEEELSKPKSLKPIFPKPRA